MTAESTMTDGIGARHDVDLVERISDDDRVRSRWQAALDPSSHIPTYAGIVLVLAGFGLLALAWAKVAGLIDVWRQMPYLVSAAFPGLGLIMTGLLIVNIAAKRQDAAVRGRQLEELTEALDDLKRSLGDER